MTALVTVPQPHDLQLFGFALYNSVTVTALFFKQSKGTAMMVSLHTHEISSYSHKQFTL